MLPAKQDLTLEALPEPRRIFLDVGAISPGNLTLIDALDIAEVSGVSAEDMERVLSGPVNRRQGMLVYAMAWVLGRRIEPGLTFAEVLQCHVTLMGDAVSDEQIEREQKRAMAVTSVAMLAGVSPDEAEKMSVAEVAAVTSITKARRRKR